MTDLRKPHFLERIKSLIVEVMKAKNANAFDIEYIKSVTTFSGLEYPIEVDSVGYDGKVARKKFYMDDFNIRLLVGANIDRFDSGYWSYYDVQYPYVGDYFYHKAIHIPQLKVLNQITGDQYFLEYAEKWENYFNEPYLSIFKLKMFYDGLHRRFTYKSFFTLGK